MWQQPLRLDWLEPQRLALSSCPGRPDSPSQLPVDLEAIVAAGITTVLSLVEEEEMRYYGVTGLREAVLAAGLEHLRFPIEDRCAPEDLAATQQLCLNLLQRLQQGERLLIHCIGGWGRTGTISACLLCHQGLEPQDAIALVRQRRHPLCVQTYAQERFVHQYAQHLPSKP